MKDWDEGVTQENVPYVILSMSGQINVIGSRSFSDLLAKISPARFSSYMTP